MLGHPVLMVLARLQFHHGQHSAVPEPSGTRAWTTSCTCSASAICLASVACSEARSRIWATSRWTPAGWARRSAIHRARLVSRRTSGSARFVVPEGSPRRSSKTAMASSRRRLLDALRGAQGISRLRLGDAVGQGFLSAFASQNGFPGVLVPVRAFRDGKRLFPGRLPPRPQHRPSRPDRFCLDNFRAGRRGRPFLRATDPAPLKDAISCSPMPWIFRQSLRTPPTRQPRL